MPARRQRVDPVVDDNEVVLLAQYENARWRSSPETLGTRTAFPASERAEAWGSTEERDRTNGEQWQAYWPLGSAEPVAAEAGRMANFQFIGATPVGRVLVVQFSWLPDPDQREFLMHWDLSESTEKDLAVASSLLFERIVRLVDAPDWIHRNTVAISSQVSLIVPTAENR
ncbi:MAG: hypothetical protein ACRDTE_19950 [Pseudonocardiaceae bacterium]